MKPLTLLLLLSCPLMVYSQFKSKRAFSTLVGVAVREGSSGYHVEVAAGYQPKGFGVGAYMGLASVPGVKFSNWTIMGLQLKGVSQARVFRPYGLFDLGLINFQLVNENLNMRTCSLDLGGGIEKSVRNRLSLMLDVRWKWLVDYRGEWETPQLFTVSLGLKIQ